MRGEISPVSIEKDTGWPQSRSGCLTREKNLLVLQWTEPRFLSFPARSLYKMPMHYLGLLTTSRLHYMETVILT